MKERDLRFGRVGLGKMGILHSCILNVLPKSSACAFRRNVLEQIEITSSDYQVESELTVKAPRNGNIVEEVPLNIRKRMNVHSHVNPLSTASEFSGLSSEQA